MKFALPLILLTFLTGCSGRVIDLSQSGAGAPVDTGPEILHVSVPEGSKVGYQANRPGVQIREYVPEGESVAHWTNMLTVLIMARSSATDIDAFFRRMTDTFQFGCVVAAVVEPPVRFFDGPYPAGMPDLKC